jgi:NAD(P)-dependent dehydrogenase (short-subunit alcohol dehydrogenase family)
VIVVGRDAARADQVLQRIQRETTGTGRFIAADLSARDGVRALANEVLSSCERLDILVNNAGGMFAKRAITPDGFERHWGLNHLAYVQLTLELLPLLRSRLPTRVVNVASGLHARGVIAFDDLQSERRYSAMKAYSQSKLANVMFTYALARRLAGSGVTVNCLHPGVVSTGLVDGAVGPLTKPLLPLVRLFLTTPVEGAATSVYVATSPAVEGVTGQYFVKCSPTQSSRASHSVAAQERLWRVSLEQARVRVPF